jgi:hypothetical protein
MHSQGYLSPLIRSKNQKLSMPLLMLVMTHLLLHRRLLAEQTAHPLSTYQAMMEMLLETRPIRIL